jgi:hypothetical protein
LKIERKQPNYFDGGGTCCSLHPSSRGGNLEEMFFVRSILTYEHPSSFVLNESRKNC